MIDYNMLLNAVKEIDEGPALSVGILKSNVDGWSFDGRSVLFNGVFACTEDEFVSEKIARKEVVLEGVTQGYYIDGGNIEDKWKRFSLNDDNLEPLLCAAILRDTVQLSCCDGDQVATLTRIEAVQALKELITRIEEG